MAIKWKSAIKVNPVWMYKPGLWVITRKETNFRLGPLYPHKIVRTELYDNDSGFLIITSITGPMDPAYFYPYVLNDTELRMWKVLYE